MDRITGVLTASGGLLVLLFASGLYVGQGMMGYTGGMYGYGVMMIMPLLWILLLGAILIGGYHVLVGEVSTEDEAMQILRDQYARGELIQMYLRIENELLELDRVLSRQNSFNDRRKKIRI